MTSRRYYPKVRSVLLAPIWVGSIFGVAALKKPLGIPLSLALFSIGFTATLLVWRWFLRAEVGDGKLRGRDPLEARRTVIELSDVTSVRAGKFRIGRLEGWVFEAPQGRAIFVPEPALADPDLKDIARAQPGQAEVRR